MAERIQKLLSAAGLMSRRAAEEAILAGRVRLNGRPAVLGDKAELSSDELLLDGRRVTAPAAPVYLMLHKPRGYVCTLSDEKGRRQVTELLQGVTARVYPVGRLDMDSEGLLLLTNDGAFANRVMHPASETDKTYLLTVRGDDPDKSIPALSGPMTLDGYCLRPAGVKLLERRGKTARLEVTIHEGRNRQLRRMCEQVGLEVLRLKRISEGPLKLGSLAPGEWRELTEEELRSFDREE